MALPPHLFKTERHAYCLFFLNNLLSYFSIVSKFTLKWSMHKPYSSCINLATYNLLGQKNQQQILEMFYV